MIERIKEPVSCLTHLGGAVASLFVTIALTARAAAYGPLHVFSFLAFGCGLILLYSASAVYHMLRLSEEKTRLLRRIDHTMIFFLIAGTYTPVCLIVLQGVWGYSLLAAIWSLAVLGTFMKIFWLTAPRLLSTAVYLIMGWLAVIAILPLKEAMSAPAFTLLLAGGIAYSLGALIYALKWPPLGANPHFGFHELFHIFVLLGSACHTLMMFCII